MALPWETRVNLEHAPTKKIPWNFLLLHWDCRVSHPHDPIELSGNESNSRLVDGFAECLKRGRVLCDIDRTLTNVPTKAHLAFYGDVSHSDRIGGHESRQWSGSIMYLELCPVSCVRRRLATVVLAKKRNIVSLEFTPSIRITSIPVDEASNVGPGAFLTRNPKIWRASVKYDFKRLYVKRCGISWENYF